MPRGNDRHRDPHACKAVAEPIRNLLQQLEKLAHPARRERDFADVEAAVATAAATVRALAQSDRWDAGIALALRPLRKKVRHVA